MIVLDAFPGSLTEQACAALKRDIVTTALAPGAPLSESGLAERYKLGKAPIRAALARLAEEGLVRSAARRGWQVTPVTLRDVREVFELRLMLEPAAAAMAAGRVDEARLRALDRVVSAGYLPGDHASTLIFLEANRDFHCIIAELSGNSRLARQIARLLDEMTRMLLLGLGGRDRTGEMAHEHRELIDALVVGDSAAAERITRAQIEESRKMVLAALVAGDGRGVSVA